MRYNPKEDHYHTLQVDPAAETSVIHHAYKALVKQYHPDKFHGSNPTQANAMMQRINAAYHVLGDAHKREYYDRLRKAYLDNPGAADLKQLTPLQKIGAMASNLPVWVWIVGVIVLMPLLSRILLVTPLGKVLMIVGSAYVFIRVMPRREPAE